MYIPSDLTLPDDRYTYIPFLGSGFITVDHPPPSSSCKYIPSDLPLLNALSNDLPLRSGSRVPNGLNLRPDGRYIPVHLPLRPDGRYIPAHLPLRPNGRYISVDLPLCPDGRYIPVDLPLRLDWC